MKSFINQIHSHSHIDISGAPGGEVRGVRTHPLRMLSALFSNVKCHFLPH